MSIQRAQHWLDEPSGNSRKRTIRNWMHYRTPHQDWTASNPAASQAQGAPPDWAGAFDFSLASLNAPLQCFARDAMDVGNRAMIGMRRSDNPSIWLNQKALNVNAVDAVISEGGRVVTYPGLWDGCDLVYEFGAHKLKETVRIWDKTIAPAYFEWTMRAAPGATLELADNVFSLKDDQGEEQIVSRPPWGKDSATTGPGIDGEQYIACTLTQSGTQAGMPVYRLTPDPDDMAAAIGVVELDPTATITGTSDVDEAQISQGVYANHNYGGALLITTSSSSSFHYLFRAADSALPSGTINSATWDIYSSLGSSIPHVFYRILPANSGWVEGDGNREVKSGQCCWNYHTYNTQGWAGGAGLPTQNTDWTNTDSSSTSTSVGWNACTISANIVQGWVDSTFANAGIICRPQSGIAQYHSSEYTNQPYWSIDYTAGPTGSPKYYFDLLARRRR